MQLSGLTLDRINRPGSSLGGCTVTERSYLDFRIDGCSVLDMLTSADGGHSDFMTPFASGFAQQNQAFVADLLCWDLPEGRAARVIIYICPECADIGCGAYSVEVERSDTGIVWDSFAYENGYESPRPISGIGPFVFDSDEYRRIIIEAPVLC
ncbi:hypothetical protein DND58_19960 [Pseudomonas syringae pv. pisi]|uniref:Oxidoreductase n=3 Tax=Pseudomonas TaxID=286 RepID=A0AAE5S826_PSESY|nr:hypothetical protein [Pseudomonas syringae]MDC3737278.1 hypothetical protein [Pseudomonas syringae pv. syringae]PYD10370.1 hypothetical protein DND62_19105 [Pseudomonas syringae pv. pisi]AVX25339.1 hypothetical protein DA456_19085 [Pseudomonas syringae pv. atrofaciens]MBI6709784.1 hypothetical protein [Pseudomonas syringae]MBI6721137.1 hypothetical protein [Pseudomonas syringae]